MFYPIKRLFVWKEGVYAIEMDRSGCNDRKIPTEGSSSDSSTTRNTKQKMNAACCVAGMTAGMLRNVFISCKKSFMVTPPLPVNFLKINNRLPLNFLPLSQKNTDDRNYIMNVYLPEFGLWRPPLPLAGRLWTPAEKEQENHM